jgi:hypothetical protein
MGGVSGWLSLDSETLGFWAILGVTGTHVECLYYIYTVGSG